MKILQVLPRSIKRHSQWLSDLAHFPVRGITALRYAFTREFLEEPFNNAEYDVQTLEKTLPPEASSKHLSFTFSAISLSAIIARADGAVTKEEYLAFRDSFPLTGGMCGKLRQLFLLSCQTQTSYVIHVQQIKQLFPNQIELFISLVDRLFRIAVADKPLSRDEERLLAKISHGLGLNPAEYSTLHERYSRPLAPHVVLGVEKRSTKSIIKQKYHQLMNRYHPDRYAHIKVSPEVQMLLTLKTSEISDAYYKMTRKAA